MTLKAVLRDGLFLVGTLHWESGFLIAGCICRDGCGANAFGIADLDCGFVEDPMRPDVLPIANQKKNAGKP